MRFKYLKATAFLLVVIHASLSYASGDFLSCTQFFANGKSPIVAPHPTDRALCYDAFAILHSGESKTPVFVAEKLNRAAIADANEKRTDRFFADSRLRSAERAELEDYKGSGYDRGHTHRTGDGSKLLVSQYGASSTRTKSWRVGKIG